MCRHVLVRSLGLVSFVISLFAVGCTTTVDNPGASPDAGGISDANDRTVEDTRSRTVEDTRQTTRDTSNTERDASTMEADSSSGCPSTHRKVGWTAELETKNHEVDGTARIVDNCTIAIENFSYDGGGLDEVQIYGTPNDPSSSSNAFEQGYAISDNLKGRSFDGERFVTTLPEGRSLDDLKAISIWCVEAGVDFGSGTFSK